MTLRQLSKLSMLMVLREFLAGNPEIVKSIPNLELLAASLHALEEEISDASRQQIFHNQGAGASKRQLKANLVLQCADVSRKLTAFAALGNDLVLLYEIKSSNSGLVRMTEEKLTAFARILLDRGALHLDRAAAYALVPQNLTELDAARQAFELAIPGPRMAKMEKKLATDKLVELFKQADELLVKADLLAGIVQLTHPNFYSGYRNARILVDRGGRHRQLILTVTDKETGQPLPGALCQLAHPDLPGQPILSGKSGPKGNLKVKSLEGGNYLLTVAKQGYLVHSREVVVTRGEFLRLRVEMERG